MGGWDGENMLASGAEFIPRRVVAVLTARFEKIQQKEADIHGGFW